MEENVLDNEVLSNEISDNAKNNLAQSSKWLKFIAIIIYVISGFYLLGIFSLLFTLNTVGFIQIPTIIFGIAITLLYFYLGKLLFKQSKALKYPASIDLDSFSVSFLSFWKIIAILTIVMLGFMIFGFLIAGAMGLGSILS